MTPLSSRRNARSLSAPFCNTQSGRVVAVLGHMVMNNSLFGPPKTGDRSETDFCLIHIWLGKMAEMGHRYVHLVSIFLTSKTHYICQTYVEAKGAKGAPAGVKIDKQFQYSTAQEAESRAERASQSPDWTCHAKVPVSQLMLGSPSLESQGTFPAKG